MGGMAPAQVGLIRRSGHMKNVSFNFDVRRRFNCYKHLSLLVKNNPKNTALIFVQSRREIRLHLLEEDAIEIVIGLRAKSILSIFRIVVMKSLNGCATAIRFCYRKVDLLINKECYEHDKDYSLFFPKFLFFLGDYTQSL